MRNALHKCLLAAAVLALAADARAQSAGSLTGTVKDTSGGALPGATVTVVNPTQVVTQTAQTDPEGVFVFAQLLPGTYSVKVELSGFKAIERSNVILPTKSAINVGELDVGSMTETVTVEADVGRLQIQTESAERSEQLGTFFGEANAARDPRIIQLGLKLYF